MKQSEAFTPPKPWNPDRFRSVITSLEDHTIIDQEAIPWCTTHDMNVTIGHKYRTWIWDGCIAAVTEWRDDTDSCVISTGGPDHKWWFDGSA